MILKSTGAVFQAKGSASLCKNVLVGIIAENTDPLRLLLNYFVMTGNFFCGIAEISKFFPTLMDFEQKLMQNMKLKKIITRKDFFRKKLILSPYLS